MVIYIFKKKIGDKNACVFYDYDSCCSWFWLKLKQPKIFGPFIVELIIQLNIVGFNSILSENLSKVYSFSKNIKFFLCFLISLFFINAYILIFRTSLVATKYLYKDYNNAISRANGFALSLFWFIFYSLFTFIFSIIYISAGEPKGNRWENCMMCEFIIFKVLDFQLLSLYDFLDDLDCINTTVVITFERFLWMIIEVIIEVLEIDKTILISIQIAFSSIFSVILFITCRKVRGALNPILEKLAGKLQRL